MNRGERERRGKGEKEHGAIHSATDKGFTSAPSPLCSPAHNSRRTSLLNHFLDWLRSKMPIRRYRVTPRQNSRAFRRSLLRDAMLELKRDAAFAIPSRQRQTEAQAR